MIEKRIRWVPRHSRPTEGARRETVFIEFHIVKEDDTQGAAFRDVLEGLRKLGINPEVHSKESLT